MEDLYRWRSVQQNDRLQAGDAYEDQGFLVTNELGKYIEQKTFKAYYDRILQDAGVGHFTFHALRHTFATRVLENGMDYKTLSSLLGHYSVAFTMDTYVHSMDERKRSEMDKMNDLYDLPVDLAVGPATYPVLCVPDADRCTLYIPDFPKIKIQADTMEQALLEARRQLRQSLKQYKHPPIPTRQENILVPDSGFLMMLRIA